MATLNFKGKAFVQNHHLLVKYHQLVPRKEKSLTDKVSLHDNIIIHGDNLKALKALLPTYAGKIKCIYIDPPYNTGKEKWIYNDNVNSPMMQEWLGKVVDKEDLTRHDKWLCMMMPRLKLLRELLTDEGVIFISINEEELAHLRLIGDEIFSEGNYLTTFSIKVRHERRILKGDKDFHEVTEYLLLYRNPAHRTIKKVVDNTSISEYIYTVNELSDYSESMKMGKRDVFLFKPGEYKVNKQSPSLTNLKKINIRGAIKEGNSSGRFYMKYLNPIAQEKAGYLAKVPDIGDDGLGFRYFLLPSGKKVNGDYFQGVPTQRTETKQVPYPNFFDFVDEFNTVGYEGFIDFRYGKKPLNFIKKLLEIGGCLEQKDSIILDSFAGSGSTAHAVLDLNKEDGGNRRFILVECEDYADKITAERVRRVIKGVPGAKDENLKNGLGGSFSYFELGEPIEMESILSGDNLPTYKELARYVFYTATGEEFDESVLDEKKNFVGESKDYLVYLFYKTDLEYLKNTALTLDRAKALGPYDKKRRLVFAPTKYLDQRHLDELRIDFAQLPFEIYQLAK